MSSREIRLITPHRRCRVRSLFFFKSKKPDGKLVDKYVIVVVGRIWTGQLKYYPV